MSIVAILSWWYGMGWANRFKIGQKRLESVLDFFSFDQLLGSLFAPFRQNGTGTNGSWLVKLGDQLVSRAIGGFIRVSMMIIGFILLVFVMIWTIFEMIIWPFVPIFPIFGLIAWHAGWSFKIW